MTGFEEELLLDAAEDARIVAHIRRTLPQELQEKFSDDQLYYFLDLIVEYYAESGILDSTPDKDGYIEIDEEAIAKHVAKKAQQEDMGNFTPEDLLFVIQAEADYQEMQEEA